MNRLFKALLAHPVFTLAGALAVAAAGWNAVRGLAVDVFPDIRAPRVVIQTETGGLTAEETEQLVTVPVESVMNGIPGVKKVRSSSSGGLSFVWVDFDWHEDETRARYRVFERLSQVRAQLPAGVEPEIAPVVSVTGEIMMIAVGVDESKTSLLEARQLCEFDLAKRILSVPGIGDVVTMGGRLPELRVAYDPAKLLAFDLAPADLERALRDTSTRASAGYLPHVRGREIPLTQRARAETPGELAAALVPTPSAGPVRLGDVARVSLAGAPRRGSASFNGRPVILLSVQKTPGGDTLALTRRVNERVAAFAAAHADAGFDIHPEAYAQAEFIDFSIRAEKDIVLSAALIVVAVLGLTLLRARTILITLLTMPLSVLAGFAVFKHLGLGIDLMTLGGLAVAVGDIVDAAIIFVEIAARRLAENTARRPAREVIAAACAEVLPSVLFSTLVILLVFAPLLFLDGLESQFFKPLALAYLAVFGASFLAAVTVTPVLCRLLLRTPKNPAAVPGAADAPGVRALKLLYRPLLALATRFPKTLLLVLLAGLAAAAHLASGFGFGFLPPFHENCYNVFVSLPPGTSLDASERLADNAAARVRALPGVASVIRRTGRAERDQHAEPVSASELVVRATPEADAAALRRAVRESLAGLPGVSVEIGYPIAHRVSAILSGTSAELTLNIFGDDLALLRKTAAQVKDLLAAVPEAGDVRANREITSRALRIEYDLPALAEAGLTLRDAGEQVAAAFNGLPCARVTRQNTVWDVTLRLDSPDGAPPVPDTVRDLPLAAPGGGRVRLGDVARVTAEEAPGLVVRENGRRLALVSCNAAPGSNVGDLVRTLREKVEPAVHAAGCDISYGGSFEAAQSASRRLAVLGAVLLALVFLILAVALRSSGRALLVLANVPLCLMGGVFALALTQPVFTVASLVGFITAVGFVIRNGLLLLNRYRELEAQGLPRAQAVRDGSLERMPPILMTSLTTILGLVPLALAWNKPGGELLGPLALVQFGGLVTATLLNLLALPALCSLGRPAAAAPRALPVLLLPLLLFAGCRSYAPAPVAFTDLELDDRTPGASSTLVLSTREELTQIALIGNLEVNELRRRHAAADKRIAAAGWWEDPTLTFSAQRILQSAKHPFLGGAELGFTLPLAGIPKLEEKAAKLYKAADAAAVRAAERSLAVDAYQAVIRLEAERRRADILDACANDPAYRAVVGRLDELARIGEASAAETQFARQDLVREQIAAEDKRMDVLRAEADLRKLLGLAPHIRLVVTGELARACLDVPENRPPPPMPDLTRHPLVRERLARHDAAETDLLIEIRKQYGSLSIGPSYNREDGQDRLGAGIGLTLPIWNRNRKGIADAEIARDEKNFSAVRTWRELALDWQAAVAQTSRRHIHHTPETVSPEQLKTLFDSGELTALEFVSFHKAHYQIRLEHLDCEEKASLAFSQLERFQPLPETTK